MTRDAVKDGLTLARRDMLKGAAAAGGALLMPGLAFGQQARKGGTLRLAMPYNPASIDPMTGRNLTDFNVLYAVFDALIDFDPDTFALKPGLAKSWRFTDHTTLVLDLVEGVKFHDGTPCDALAVKFNLDRYRRDPRSNVKADLVTVADVRATGPLQVTLELTRPNAGLPSILTNRVGLIVSPKSIQDNGPNIDRIAVGTGPFKFVNWQDNISFTLTRNESYWRPGLPYLDGINLRIINELNTALRTVTAGEADLVINLTSQQKIVADRSPELVVDTTLSLIFVGVLFNYGRPPLNDVRVRQALNYAINREEIVKVLSDGLSPPSSAILPKKHWACDPQTADYYSYDPGKAKALLAAAGHPDGLTLEAWGWADQASIRRQEIAIAQLERSGIHIKLTPVSPQQAMQSFLIDARGDLMFTPGSGTPDPSQFYDSLFGKTAFRNAGKVELPGFRELLDATMDATDQEVRKLAFAKLQRFVIEQALVQVQYIGVGIAARTPKVHNFSYGLLTTPKFADVWLDA